MKFYIRFTKVSLVVACIILSQGYLWGVTKSNSIKSVDSPLRVAVIGTGYVGLVSGVGLAEMGHAVVCADNDPDKINKLNQKNLPIYEPGLQEIVVKNYTAKRLSFTNDVDKAIRDAEIIIVAVGTPMNDAGEADLSALMSVLGSIAKNLNSYKVICLKSTVPIGTNKAVKAHLTASGGFHFDIVSNPEFLREGSALDDFFNNNPIVLGSDSEMALLIMEGLYKPLFDRGTKLIKTDFTSAETIKYAWNSYSTIKVAYVNQLSRLCNAANADITTVVKGMSFSEKLLPIGVVKPGPGIGGSCLPKDTAALVAMSKKLGVDMGIVVAARQANESHKKLVTQDLLSLLDNTVTKKKIAILGLSFKANTDDIRYSPAIDVLKELVAGGAEIYAYDPKAMDNMKRLFPDVHYCSSAEEALTGADALVLLTDWEEFKRMNIAYVAEIMAQRNVVDARNIFNPKELIKLHFNYKNLGYRAAI